MNNQSPDIQLQEMRKHMRPVDWTSDRKDRVLRKIQKRRRRFTLSTVALGSAVLAMAASIVIIWFAQGQTTRAVSTRSPEIIAPKHLSSAQKGIELGDGSRALDLGGGSSLVLVSETDSKVSFSLDSGKAWFDVKPSESREVEVVIHDVRVQVSGTEFVVEVVDEFVHVWVHKGSLRVENYEGIRTMEKGENRRFLARSPNTSKDKREKRVDDDKGKTSSREPAKRDRPVINEAKKSGTLEEAMEDSFEPEMVSEAPGATPVSQSQVSELWAQADSARRGGNDKVAVRALATLVNEHSSDPRAALAAFTLGRVLVDSNRQHKTAARAFAKARKLAPGGPLVEDALFREIEAWYNANDMRRVVSRSEKYFRMFPKGRYRRQVLELKERGD